MPEQINDTTFEVTLIGGDKVEIGDKDSVDFKPHIKLNRWDGECFIKIQMAGDIEGEVEYELEDGKVKTKYKIKYGDFELEVETEFYPLEPTTVFAKDKDGNDVEFKQCQLGGFEFEVILKKKPPTNKIVLDIETQGLKFYHLPELTPEEIAGGCIQPDNVVGSYAVYHATRTSMHKGKADAEKYKAGKAFHIYRPKITDADGKWVWGELFLDEQSGTLTTTIPQDFLVNAVYPVSTGTTNFGWEQFGASFTMGYGLLTGSVVTASPAEDGIAVSMSVYAKDSGDSVKMALYDGGTLIDYTAGVSLDAGASWKTANVILGSSVLAAVSYYLIFKNDADISMYYDMGAPSSTLRYSNSYADPFPTPITWSSAGFNMRFSIYCTYEVAAPPTGQPYISRVQGVQGMRSYGGI